MKILLIGLLWYFGIGLALNLITLLIMVSEYLILKHDEIRYCAGIDNWYISKIYEVIKLFTVPTIILSSFTWPIQIFHIISSLFKR